MSVMIPSSRVYLYEKTALAGGSDTSVMPERPRLSGGATEATIGGTETMDTAGSATKLYVLVNSAGVPLSIGGRQKAYEAASPAAAATKAFYAWWRTKGLHSKSLTRPEGLETLRSNLKALDAPESAKKDFLKSLETVNAAKVRTKLLVRIAAAGTNRVRNYLVAYEVNTNPNRHEVLKGITLLAKARLISPSDARPEGIIDLESHI